MKKLSQYKKITQKPINTVIYNKIPFVRNISNFFNKRKHIPTEGAADINISIKKFVTIQPER
jgi:hypothetical protein